MLDGLRVLDFSDESGFLAGKVLGDLGADVVKVEPPGGDRAGRRGPFLGDIEDPERSLPWLALNTSKRGITLGLEHPRGPELFRQLLYPLPWADRIFRSSATRGTDPHLLAAVIREESRFDARVVSAASARGLGQFVFSTAQRPSARASTPSGSLAPPRRRSGQ